MLLFKRFRKGIKIIKQSEVLSKEEKREYIIKGTIEELLNSWKWFAKLPFTIIGITFVTLECLFGYLAEGASLVEQVFRSIVLWLDDRRDITLTNGETREKLLKEIKEKNIKKVY